jgi:predicted  nucleic acid-binding Zn-ribbon protein
MSGPAAILREIHRLRRHAKDLQTEIDRGPQALKARQAKVIRQEELLREAQESLKRLKVATHEKEVTLKAKMEQVVKHERQLAESTHKKEYDALKAEVAAEKAAAGKLEDEIIDGLTAIEERAAQLPEMEKAIRQAKEEAARFEGENQARQSRLAEQLTQVDHNLQQVEESLPADVHQDYARMTAARGEEALAGLQGRTCTACYTEVTAQSYNELLQGRFVVCKSCGRMLYLPE